MDAIRYIAIGWPNGVALGIPVFYLVIGVPVVAAGVVVVDADELEADEALLEELEEEAVDALVAEWEEEAVEALVAELERDSAAAWESDDSSGTECSA